MNVTLTPPTKIQNKIPLKTVPKGGCFHYASETLTEAIAEERIWMRVDAPEVKAGRVRVVNVVNGSQLERDDDHPVIALTVSIQIQNQE